MQHRPVRAGVFNDVASARNAISQLREGGFTNDEITVICSDETKERIFREFEHQDPAGANTPVAAATGSAVGATLFGLATAVIGTASGNVPLAVAGGWGVWTGGVLGGFIGAMLTRGVEKEAADYYDQAVVQGKILIAVEHHGPQSAARLHQAENILSVAGAEPVALREG
jgi:hypothetical protein